MRAAVALFLLIAALTASLTGWAMVLRLAYVMTREAM